MRGCVKLGGIALFAVSVLSSGQALAQGKVAKLTTLEWPPYTGATLKDGGMSSAVIKAAYAAVGWRVEIAFLPWKRAVDTARSEAAIAGYFPEYTDPTVEVDFTFSPSIGTSPLGLVERVAKPIKWEKIGDLAAYRIGTVDGYVNTEEFDKAATAGTIKVDPVKDDATNLRKLDGGRIDAAVIDRNVFTWEITHTADLAGLRQNLRFNDRLLADNQLFVAFRKSPVGDAARAAFAEGLQKIDRDKVLKDHLMSMLERPGLLLVAGL